MSKNRNRSALLPILMMAGLLNSAFAETLTHKDGDFLVAGDFNFNKEGLDAHFEGLAPSEYGYFFLEDIMNFETQQMFSIKGRELHYYISSDPNVAKKSKSLGIGVRPIPVVNGRYDDLANAPVKATAANANGVSVDVRGSELMDNYLRKAFGYQGQDLVDGPIFAYMAYNHPEKSKSRIKFSQLGNPSTLKTENGTTHLGAYIGNGETRNSPVDYHRNTWGHKSGKLTYPVNMYVMKYGGAADQKTFNTNGIIALKTLNELNGGPKFPPDYKFDKFKTISLAKNLDFYRAWIDTEWKKNANDTQSVYEKMTATKAEWDTYCAEHLTIALNIAMNVEHNEASFKKIWGEVEGADLWKKLNERWSKDLKQSFAPIVDQDFEMLWEIDKVKNPTDKNGVGKAMAWAPETTADLVRDFVQQYVPFYRVGAMNTAFVIFGFAKEFEKRVGMPAQEFAGLAIPVLSKMFKYEIALQLTNKGLSSLPNAEEIVSAIAQKYFDGLDMIAQAKPEMAPAVPALKGAIQMILANPAEVADTVAKAKQYNPIPSAARRGVKANDDFLQDAQAAFKKAVNTHVAQDEGVYRVKYYSPPAILRRIYLGLHKSHNMLKVWPVASAVRAEDVEPKAVPATNEEADLQEGVEAEPAADSEADAQ